MIATKIHFDVQIFSSTLKLFSLIGGVSTDELFVMESEFMAMLDYKFYISEEEFTSYRETLMS